MAERTARRGPFVYQPDQFEVQEFRRLGGGRCTWSCTAYAQHEHKSRWAAKLCSKWQLRRMRRRGEIVERLPYNDPAVRCAYANETFKLEAPQVPDVSALLARLRDPSISSAAAKVACLDAAEAIDKLLDEYATAAGYADRGWAFLERAVRTLHQIATGPAPDSTIPTMLAGDVLDDLLTCGVYQHPCELARKDEEAKAAPAEAEPVDAARPNGEKADLGTALLSSELDTAGRWYRVLDPSTDAEHGKDLTIEEARVLADEIDPQRKYLEVVDTANVRWARG